MSEKSIQASDWQAAINNTFHDLSQQLIDYAPQLVGAILLLTAGWATAFLLKLAARKLVQGLDALFSRFQHEDDAEAARLQKSYANIVGSLVFWSVLVFFIAASANMLGWEMFTGWVDSLVGFLPKLVSGLLIILIGFLVANAARGAILSTVAAADIGQSQLLARLVQIVILFSSVVIGAEQIGLNVQFLTSVIVVVIGTLLAGAALSFGLGATNLVANIIGAQHARKQCRIGEHMKIGQYEGDLLEVTRTAIVLDCADGRAVIPAKCFLEEVSLLNPESDANI